MYQLTCVTWFTRILISLFLCAATSRVSFAQEESWSAECPACAQHLGGNGSLGRFATWDECDKARRAEVNLGFPGFTECHKVSPSSASQRGWLTPGAAVIGSTVVFGTVGGLSGTFWNNPQGQTFGYGGAALGAGTFGFAALALNARKMSRPVVVLTSALDFAAIGAGTAQAVQFKQEWANPQAPAPNNKSIVVGATVGAVAGAVVGFVLPHLTGSATSQKLHPFIRALGHLQFGMTPRL
jgi:hypothetical protein